MQITDEMVEAGGMAILRHYLKPETETPNDLARAVLTAALAVAEPTLEDVLSEGAVPFVHHECLYQDAESDPVNLGKHARAGKPFCIICPMCDGEEEIDKIVGRNPWDGDEITKKVVCLMCDGGHATVRLVRGCRDAIKAQEVRA